MSKPTWTCAVCQEPASGQAASLWIDPNKALDRYWEEREWANAHNGKLVSMAEMGAMPKSVSWRVTHDKCEMPPDGSYWISLDRIATHEAVIEWTAHLMGKVWLNSTTWADLLYRLARPAKSRRVA